MEYKLRQYVNGFNGFSVGRDTQIFKTINDINEPQSWLHGFNLFLHAYLRR